MNDLLDDSELWVSEEEGESRGSKRGLEEPYNFTLDLVSQGQPGGYHVRNHGQIQRVAVSDFRGGFMKRAAFYVSCTAMAIVHGTLDPFSGEAATLIVYDFRFFGLRTRIKSADITFKFLPQEGTSREGPTVEKLAPQDTHSPDVSRSEQAEEQTRTLGVNAGANSLGVDFGVNGEQQSKISKTTTHEAEITGYKPWDDHTGDYNQACWQLKENESQQTGIVKQLRTAVLLKREHDDRFNCVPTIEARPDLKIWSGSIFSGRNSDDPIILDPKRDPYNKLGNSDVVIDRWNLGDVDLDQIWDCTFRNVFRGALKDSRSRVEVRITADGSVEKVDKIL